MYPRRTLVLLALAGFTMFAASSAGADSPARADDPPAEAAAWFAAFAPDSAGAAPFSFSYGGRPSSEFLAHWTRHVAERAIDAARTERVVTYLDPATKLEVRVVAVTYRDFPTTEWTVYFRNTGTSDTPIISEVQSLDVTWTKTSAADYRLHYSNGTKFPPGREDFMPREKILTAASTTRLAPYLARSTVEVMPYFNLDRGDGSGVIVVLGWSGGWSAEFARDAGTGIRVKGGLEFTHLKLHPGEEIRGPLVVLQAWRGDWIAAQNTWRRWMLVHNLPQPWGRLPQPILAASSSQWYEEMVKADEASQLRFMERYAAEKIPLDIWWMDAGWYENNGRWQQPRSLRVDRARFPRGLRAVIDVIHQRGLKSVVWFEPTRVMPDNELTTLHPDWLLSNPTPGLISRLLDLGNPAARAWLVDVVSRHVDDDGFDVYREDHCIIEMGAIFRAHDAPDRQGITENHHVTGHYAVWDELRRRFPHLVIDDCGGGGSRLDLELMRRSLPYFRSDYIFDLVSNQCQTYGLSLWIPYFGEVTGPTQFTTYELRSNFSAPLVGVPWDLRDPSLPYDTLRRTVGEWRSIADCYNGDFYPLTPCTLSEDVWLAWQFDVPEKGRGMIQAYRRALSNDPVQRVRLRGLEPAAHYRLTNLDQPAATVEFTGTTARNEGLELVIPENPGAGIWRYERIGSASAH